MGPCTYKLKAYEVVKGLEIAISLGWYDFTNFDHLEYEYYEMVQNGDLNWIIPGKFIAFMGPSGRKREKGDNFKTTPEDYIKPFERFGVTHVVRLNKPQYEAEVGPSPAVIHETWHRPHRHVLHRWVDTTY